ncbi:ABC transporter ATP-binding protein [Eubacterium sp. 1001713B170207_170306_E7]|uniref:ABC transporter ATP-binding protein n=1 Tax=Eubacterium sp. 1001713B170207_170306_E7 TaxID=2787097 RepID=UPI00189C5444|nr:ABC transporter ATP-binding protein [Eubacterium sp. 1001713B170207_170306_E7]
MTTLLDIKNLSVNIDTDQGCVHAVRDVSLTLKPGETLAIVGESGCGKSVFCKSILGILPVRARVAGGAVLFKGRELTGLPEKALEAVRGKEIAMIFQDPVSSLNPTMSIGSQIVEAVRAHQKLDKAEARKLAVSLMEQVGIDMAQKRFDQYPHQFSGGMLQRSVIAMALACGPDILIADEPTTALDVTIQSQILKLLKEIQKRTGVAILFITHDLGVVARMADRVAVMYAGRLVELGTVDDIFYDPRHPYTWGLLSSLPSTDGDEETLNPIPGTPPDLINPPRGDAFAPRNPYALAIDYEEAPPMFKISGTHYAATWLLDPRAPRIEPPVSVENGRVIKRQEVFG